MALLRRRRTKIRFAWPSRPDFRRLRQSAHSKWGTASTASGMILRLRQGHRFCVAAGMVTLAETDLYFTGGTIIVNHGHGLSTVYSYLSKIDVKMVKPSQGQKIGRSGQRAVNRAASGLADQLPQERLDPVLLAGPKPN